MPLIIKTANDLLRNNIALQDLIHEGVIGLYHAISKYEFERNNSFSTYAMNWIKFKMSQATKNVFSIQISQYYVRKFLKCNEELKKNSLRLQEPMVSYVSLDDDTENINKKSRRVRETIPDKTATLPGIHLSNLDRYEDLYKNIHGLSEQEQYIIKSRYGLECNRKKLRELASELNM